MNRCVFLALEPLRRSTSVYRDGRGRTRRLTVVAVPKEKPDLDRLADVVLQQAMQQLEERRRQEAVTRGEVILLSAPPSMEERA